MASNCVCLVGVPSPGRYIKSILLTVTNDQSKEAKLTFVTSEIQFTGMIVDNAALWSANTKRLLFAFERSFRCVPSSFRSLAQMRVTLGSFNFERYRLPQDSQNGYTFDEFENMLSQSMTRGHMTTGFPLDELLTEISRASQIFILNNADSRVSAPRRSVIVDFAPKNDKTIHLEVDFRTSGGLYEKVSSRWVESDVGRPAAKKGPLLQAVILNPERADLEFEIKEKLIPEPGQLDQSMRDVQAYLRFGLSGNDTVDTSLLAPARRHSRLPIDAKISCLTEKSAVQYQIRDTDYVLEIARYDVYYPKKSRARRAADSTSCLEFKAPISSSEAVLFGQNWDQAMKTFTKLQNNGSFNLNSALAALFKPEGQETPIDALERFIMIATNVAGLWNTTSSRPMESIPRPVSPAMTKTLSANEGILIDLD